VRYFFNLADGDEQPDHTGMDLENDAAARQEAVLRAMDPTVSFRLARYGDHASILVRDETGRIVCDIPIQH
jgi:hypothetical protein